MTQTSDPEEFVEKWNSHISTIHHLRNTLPQERGHEVKEHVEGLQSLVADAAKELEEDE